MRKIQFELKENQFAVFDLSADYSDDNMSDIITSNMCLHVYEDEDAPSLTSLKVY